MIKGTVENGVDPEHLFELYIKAMNDCIKGRSDDMTTGIHLCRGNYKVLAFSKMIFSFSAGGAGALSNRTDNTSAREVMAPLPSSSLTSSTLTATMRMSSVERFLIYSLSVNRCC